MHTQESIISNQSFGLGLALNRKIDAKGNASWGVGLPVKCSFNEQMRDILPTIGTGRIATDAGGLELLNRNVDTHIGATSTDSAALDATVPVSDIVDLVQTQLYPAGVAAGDGNEEDSDEDSEKAKLDEQLDEARKMAVLMPWTAESLEKFNNDISKLTSYIQAELDNVCEKFNLAKENIAWAKENKIEAAKAIGNWVIDHPDEAMNIGLNIAALVPLFKSFKVIKPIVDGLEDIIFIPDEGFKKLDLKEHSISGKYNYKAVIEQTTGIERKIPKKHQEYVDALKGFDNWPEVADYIQHLPEGYELRRYPEGNKTTGLVFKKGDHNEIVFKKGRLDSEYPSQYQDYVSYTEHGMRVTKNGDLLYRESGNIMRKDAQTGKIQMIPAEEIQRLGITRPEEHPDVHIPVKEFIEKFGKK